MEAYLGEGERVVGRWHGTAAAALGLGEEVRAGQLTALLDGFNPLSGEHLAGAWRSARGCVPCQGRWQGRNVGLLVK